MNRLACSASLIALLAAAAPVGAQTMPTTTDIGSSGGDAASTGSLSPTAAPSGDGGSPRAAAPSGEDIVVTATRRRERLQDVPLSVTAFSQAELTQKGIVGFEGVARETPGVVLDERSDNNLSITTRGISVNGYEAGLQSTTTVYLDDLPLTTIGNSVTLDPSLFDIERVEFLRGPQGTLFGSGSLSGALRILTHSPDLTRYSASGLMDIGVTPDGGGVRQRYNGMVNIPLVDDKLGLRVVGFYRHEDGYIDNLGTGVKNSNTLRDYGGRASLLYKPTDRLSIKLMALYEDSHPEDASMITPSLGDRERYTKMPDLYTSKTQLYNATIDYQFAGAHLTSSSSYGYQTGKFNVDLSGTFSAGNPIQDAPPYYMYINGVWKTFVQETRLVSDPGGPFDWTVGGYYLHRNEYTSDYQTSTPAFYAANGITGAGPDAPVYNLASEARTYELAGFGELTYHVTRKLSITGGIRYGRYGGKVNTDPGGYTTNFYTYAYYAQYHLIYPGPFAVTPIPAARTRYPSSGKASWKASVTYKPSNNLTTYVTVSTGYRVPQYNSTAGSADPGCLPSGGGCPGLTIPNGAGSDNLTNYEVGLKGRWFGGKLTTNLSAYYIDWRNLQVQASRPSDSTQFVTNIGGAVSKGIEAEISVRPIRGIELGLNGALNQAKITSLTAEQAVVTGATVGSRLASPHLQGSLFGTYSYKLMGDATGFTSFQIEHVGSFPVGFPYTPGSPGVPSTTFDKTDSYTNLNFQSGIKFPRMDVTFYMENVTNSRAVTYVYPVAYTYSRYTILRPRTFGVRVGFNL